MLPVFDVHIQNRLKSKVIKYYEFEFKHSFIAATDFITIRLLLQLYNMQIAALASYVVVL